ncbi:hypothetical protein ACFQXA_08635 [Nocardiopsis composta]
MIIDVSPEGLGEDSLVRVVAARLAVQAYAPRTWADLCLLAQERTRPRASCTSWAGARWWSAGRRTPPACSTWSRRSRRSARGPLRPSATTCPASRC